jgi:hypothetical protein
MVDPKDIETTLNVAKVLMADEKMKKKLIDRANAIKTANDLGMTTPKENEEIDFTQTSNEKETNMTEAETNLLKMGCTDVQLFKGFFENSIPEKKSNLGKIAILRLDGDWYSSTMTCLNELYDLIMPGGFIIIDDYGHWQGCKTAVDKFRKNRNISGELFQTDYTEFWWVK